MRYKQAVDQYLKEKGYTFKALVAFSGTVRDGGADYTEANMNGFPEAQTAEMFKREEYRIPIVAYKFQTGFDQPLLHTMYVDKKLGGVNAVQTLSRLNRVAPGKAETFVLDFANEAEEIQKAFEPYYDRALLREGTDPNLLYDLQTKLANFHFYTTDEINRFAAVYFDPKGTQDRLHAALQPAVDRYRAASEDERVPFRGHLKDFVSLYAFLSQIITFVDAELEKLYVFGRLLLRKLPVTRERLPVEIQRQIDVESYRVQKTGNGSIKLKRGAVDLEPIKSKDIEMPLPEQVEPLSQIIRELNERFGTAFTDEDRIFIEHLEAKLADSDALEKAVKVNTPDNARLTFDHVVNDKLQEMIDTNFKFYKQVTDDPDFAKTFLDWLFARYLKKVR
ncbi:MAG: hypothetical protein AB1555_03875 [Nitrospirota bacterium]